MISIGTYALSYPGTLLSCGLSQLMFGDLNSVIEIFAILHLLAGYYLTYRWARLLGINPVFSVTLGISLVLSGYFFVAGRSWYYMFPVALWLPVLLLSAENFIRSRAGWRWAVLTGVAIALFFHAGNAQMWFHAIMVWTMLMLCAFLTRRVLFSEILQVTGALLIALALMPPLLLAQGFHASGLDRLGGIGIGIFPRLWAMFLPGPLFETPDSGLGGNERYTRLTPEPENPCAR